ncbi:MAG: TlpA family protein disulfide reductase [Acidobacteria bacterium]|nr:TlpA family protein disulfide reductase [Acidobacteriota bacterium]
MAVSLVFAQKDRPAKAEKPDTEGQDLATALTEAGNSPVDFIRALEKHLKKYPNSPHKDELERALVKAAVDANDNRAIVLYGERVLARDGEDIRLLDRVSRALLESGDKAAAGRALKYARKYQELVTKLRARPPQSRLSPAAWAEQLDRGEGRALVLQAQATGNLGNFEQAAALAVKSYEAFPTSEAAREAGRWLAREGKDQEAVARLADAFTIPDARNTGAERAKDRVKMGELYSKVNGSEKGLGDLILEAYDRTTALVAARKLRLRASDPNAQLTNPMEFTLSGLDGKKLSMTALKGKTVVMDFWATWCGPCRAQHPLYEEVKQRFRDKPDVVFVSINTDEDREAVKPFLEDMKWREEVYFEDGLSRALDVSSIPTTIVVSPRGEIASRMNGFLPDRFVDMLSERIREAAAN